MPLLLCPNCNVSMQNVARSGVELDMCPSCRGVWLDRGEIDKIVERSAAIAPAASTWTQPPPAGPSPAGWSPAPSAPYASGQDGHGRQGGHSSQGGHGGGYRSGHGRKKSWLGEIFD